MAVFTAKMGLWDVTGLEGELSAQDTGQSADTFGQRARQFSAFAVSRLCDQNQPACQARLPRLRIPAPIAALSQGPRLDSHRSILSARSRGRLAMAFIMSRSSTWGSRTLISANSTMRPLAIASFSNGNALSITSMSMSVAACFRIDPSGPVGQRGYQRCRESFRHRRRAESSPSARALDLLTRRAQRDHETDEPTP